MVKNIILALILIAIASGAGMYLYRAKKRGEHCVGCPYAKQCKTTHCQGTKAK